MSPLPHKVPHKVSRDLFVKAFHGRWGINFFGGSSIWVNFFGGEGAVLHGEVMIRSCQRWGSFTNAFSSNVKTLNL